MLGKGIRAEVACGKGLWPVYVDASQLEAAIINLVINARDAMPDGGRLRVSARNRSRKDAALKRHGLTDDYVELSVADTGTGMAPEVKARAFEPFFTTKEAGKGTGLGLSTIYGFVRQSGGAIAIDSELGSGTTIRLFLPRASPQAEEPAAAGAPGAVADILAGRHVLVVDDEKQVRSLARSMLEDMGCEVTVAEDAEAALRHLEQGAEIALLFTDCMMPGRLDGPALAVEARRRIPQLPVLFTSGVQGRVEMSGEAGRNMAFLPKPYTAEQLAAAMRTLLSRCSG